MNEYKVNYRELKTKDSDKTVYETIVTADNWKQAKRLAREDLNKSNIIISIKRVY